MAHVSVLTPSPVADFAGCCAQPGDSSWCSEDALPPQAAGVCLGNRPRVPVGWLSATQMAPWNLTSAVVETVVRLPGCSCIGNPDRWGPWPVWWGCASGPGFQPGGTRGNRVQPTMGEHMTRRPSKLLHSLVLLLSTQRPDYYPLMFPPLRAQSWELPTGQGVGWNMGHEGHAQASRRGCPVLTQAMGSRLCG